MFQQKRMHMYPYLRELLAQRDAWFVPCAPKEPFTLDMFQALAKYLQAQKDPMDTFLLKDFTVFDWTCLGLFTGSRVSKYAQMQLCTGTRFNIIPTRPDSGIWGGQALAFLRANFTFYLDRHELIPLSDLMTLHRKGQIVAMHIRFRFHKSTTNFSIHKFQSTKDSILDRVAAAISCIYQADLLCSPMWEPISVFHDQKKGTSFLRDNHISKTM
jgi:hypothetical protein